MDANEQAKSWCRRLTNAARFTIRGDNADRIVYSPCCHVTAPDSKVTTRDDLARVQQSTIEFVDKNKHWACDICVQREKTTTKRSIRQIGHQSIPEDAETGKLNLIEFQFDIRCNAACVMCGPHLSTLWQQEWKMPVNFTEKKAKEFWKNMSDWIDWEPVRTVYFSGGEPLLTNTPDMILQSIPDLSHIHLKYSTNGSVMPSDSTLEHWKKVKKITLEISLDGTNDQYDYIRYPLKWSNVESNVHKIVNWIEQNTAQPEVNINYTVNPLNLLYLQEMDHWFDQIQNKFSIIKKLEYGECSDQFWGLNGISESLIDQFYNTHGSTHAFASVLADLKLDSEKRHKLKSNLEELDRRRGLDWKHAFSKSVSLFDS